jgi:hypothetical protein
VAIKHGNAEKMAGDIEAERLNRITLRAASLAGKALTPAGRDSIWCMTLFLCGCPIQGIFAAAIYA